MGRAAGLGHRLGVADGRVEGALRGAHVGEGGVESGGLGGRAVVRAGGLVLGILELGPGDAGEGRAVVWEAEGSVSDLCRGVLLLRVMARVGLLCLDLGFGFGRGGGRARGSRGASVLLGDPGGMAAG